MKKREAISHIMSKNLITVNHTNTMMDVKNIFSENKIRHIPVVSGEKLIGLISKTDFLRLTYNVGAKEVQGEVNYAILNTLKIEEAMTKDLVTVEQQDTIHDVAMILMEKNFHAVPVTENGNLRGIVSTTDILKYFLEQY